MDVTDFDLNETQIIEYKDFLDLFLVSRVVIDICNEVDFKIKKTKAIHNSDVSHLGGCLVNVDRETLRLAGLSELGEEFQEFEIDDNNKSCVKVMVNHDSFLLFTYLYFKLVEQIRENKWNIPDDFTPPKIIHEDGLYPINHDNVKNLLEYSYYIMTTLYRLFSSPEITRLETGQQDYSLNDKGKKKPETKNTSFDYTGHTEDSYQPNWSEIYSKSAASDILDVSTKTINRVLANNPKLVKPITKQKWRFDKNDPLFEKLR